MKVEIKKSKSEKIVVSTSELNGKKFLDIRTWQFLPDNQEYMPTKKGITLSQYKFVEELINAINNNKEEIESWLEDKSESIATDNSRKE